MAGPEFRRISTVPEARQSEELAKVINTVVEQIIDAEVMYQDAVRKLEKTQAHMLDKLKEYVDQEYDKSVLRMRRGGVPEDHIREMEPVARRMLERNLVSTEYARSRIMDNIKARVDLQAIRDYYEAHKNEFQSVDKVVWQDIFIPVSANAPEVNDVKRFAEGLLAKCKTPADFERLMVYNDGDSKLRNGEGLGQRRGEIRPPEMEATLFQLREGEIGPIIPFPTGVHLIRVQKREYAGQMPLDDAVHKVIRKKLENLLADREYRRIVRELRSRAVIVIVRDTP
jgi:peptidyl-prolyl cis-trans isomerase SurA